MENNSNNYINIMENVNVSEQNDIVAFFKVIAILLGIVFAIFLAINLIANIVIDNLSLKQELQLEKFLSSSVHEQFKNISLDDKNKNILKIKELEQNIFTQEPQLQKYEKFKYHIIKTDEVNAFVTADGTIYITDKLLDEIKNDEQLTFILAHEIGHYVHRDHLKTFSRGLAGVAVCGLVSVITGDNDITNIATNAINFTEIKHSQSAEMNADKFANKITLKTYHSNAEVIKFFEYIGKQQGNSNLLYFFATHPSPDKRIENLKHQRI